MLQTPGNPHTRLAAQLAGLLLVAATGGLLLLTFSEQTVNRNANTQSRTLWPCQKQTLEQRVAAADLIVTATVFAVIPSNGTANVLFTPQRVFKGQVPPTGITVAARTASATTAADDTGDLHFTSADPPYLLFLKQRDGNAFTTSACFGSRTLGDGLKSEEQQLLGAGKLLE